MSRITDLFDVDSTDDPTGVWLDYSNSVGTREFLSIALYLNANGWDGRESVTYRDAGGNSTTSSFQIDFFEFFNIIGTDGGDLIKTRDGADTITTGSGDDFIDVGSDAASDWVSSGGGDDFISGVSVHDYVNGGSGFDRVTFNLSSGTSGFDYNAATGVGSGDLTLAGIEQITGRLSGGDDIISAGAQLLDLNGHLGHDLIKLDYSQGLAGVASVFTSVELKLDDDSYYQSEAVHYLDETGTATFDSFDLFWFEAFDITATTGNDRIRTKDGDDTIHGGNGDNYIVTAGGADTVTTGSGRDSIDVGSDLDIDTVSSGAGDDIITGVRPGDSINGGSGVDLVTLDLWSGTSGFSYNASNGSGSGDLTLAGVEQITGKLSRGEDVIAAGGQLHSLNGLDGHDVLKLDYSQGLAGVASAFTRVSLRLDSDTYTRRESVQYLDDSGKATSISFELNGFEVFEVIGTDGSDVIFTKDGDDIIETGVGNDYVATGGGDDFVEAGAGADTLEDSSGNDTASYESSDAGVQVNLGSGTATGGHAEGDSLKGFENLIGSDFDDTLTGNWVTNVLNGRGGNDTLFGADGNDVLIGGAGDDVLDGGDGIDTASYQSATSRVVVTLNPAIVRDTGEGIDTFISIENITGSNFNDRITGDQGDNILSGGLGDDELIGLGGNDTLNGDSGHDTLTGSGGDDILNGGLGDDVLNGSGGRDELNGNEGNDYLNGGSGRDTMDGGTGADDIFGNFGADTIDGGADNDNIRAGGSGDTIDGGDGNDRIVGGNGKDTIWGGRHNDVLFGGEGHGNGDGLRDVFVFKSQANGGGGFDIIRDFEDGIDKLDLSESGYAGFADVLADATQNGAHLEINFDFGGIVRINNFTLAELNEGDFLFLG